ncbi:hypothetical protein BpHYR1_010794 [Brachionus plicatilis]|uniref:Uncharacterized protein n=1 Tax=Brachionus plicatilis TaxID=10195 RepID=A0A3M7QW60_BRAPC|nr:hypothetical protein BpHYR1_010794 [Brachionus plicatilis]
MSACPTKIKRRQIGISAVLDQSAHQVVDQLQLVARLAGEHQLDTVTEQIVGLNGFGWRLSGVTTRIVWIVELVFDQLDQHMLDKTFDDVWIDEPGPAFKRRLKSHPHLVVKTQLKIEQGVKELMGRGELVYLRVKQQLEILFD